MSSSRDTSYDDPFASISLSSYVRYPLAAGFVYLSGHTMEPMIYPFFTKEYPLGEIAVSFVATVSCAAIAIALCAFRGCSLVRETEGDLERLAQERTSTSRE